MKIYTDLLKAVGIGVRDLDPLDIFLASGAIIHSQTLQKYLIPHIHNGQLPSTARQEVLLSGEVSAADMKTIREEAERAILPKIKGSRQ